MDQFQEQGGEQFEGEQQGLSQEPVYPPKYTAPPASVRSIWIRSLLSLAVYLAIGYYIFPTYQMLLLITAIVVFHECGHFLAMKFFRYKDLGIFFIPLLGAYVSGSKRDVSQKESAVILLAGPLPGILVGIGFYLLGRNDAYAHIGHISFETIGLAFILLNLINLLPIYPLDGGQLLNRVFLDEDSWVSKFFVILSAGFIAYVALFQFGAPSGLPLLVFPLMMLLRLGADRSLNRVEKKVEEEHINMDCSWDELTDEQYWKVRDILVTEHPTFRDEVAGPPYQYSDKEERIMQMIQGMLHRHLIQDMSLPGKLLVFVICAAAFASPWLIDMDMSFLRRFGL